MRFNSDLADVDFDSCYVLCICEGNTERAIMDILLDNDMLVFSREQLVNGEVIKRTAAQHLINDYLQFDYEKELLIFRILDSKREKFSLPKAYDRYRVFNFYTVNEIEMVFINYDNLYDEFQKKQSKLKASSFYKGRNKEYYKSYEYAKKHLADLPKLCEALRRSKRKGELGIYDLLKL